MKVCAPGSWLNGWEEWEVVTLEDLLEKLPAEEREDTAALLKRAGVSPREVLAVLENFVRLPATDRKMVLRIASSEDPNTRGKALALAAALPPPVDPGLVVFRKAVLLLKKAALLCHAPEFKVRISEVAEEGAAILKRWEKWERAEKAKRWAS